MPRAVWSGAISFGLVTIPVKLYNAVSRKSISFNQLDERTGSRIKYRKGSAETGEEVPAEQIVRAWEFTKGSYVLVDEDELETFAPKGGKAIGIEAFVGLDEIDPVVWDQSYYAVPEPGFEKAYVLLLRALERSGRVAICTFVRGSKQHLAAIRPNGDKLDISTLVWADEVVSPTAIEELDAVGDVELSDAELAMADQLIDQLVAGFDHTSFHDTYREQVLDLLRRKAEGEEIVALPTATGGDDTVLDLLAALEASVAAAKAGRADPVVVETSDDGSAGEAAAQSA